MHRSAVDLDRFKLSPTCRCIAPVARNLRQTYSCRSGGNGDFLFVGRTMPIGFISLKIYIEVSGKNLYRRKTSSASKSSKGFERSQNWRDLLAIILLRRRCCRTWAAISFPLSTALRLLQCLLKKSLFYVQCRTQAEHENVLKNFLTSVLCSDK